MEGDARTSTAASAPTSRDVGHARRRPGVMERPSPRHDVGSAAATSGPRAPVGSTSAGRSSTTAAWARPFMGGPDVVR